ncbi:hypothetical protein [Herbiconiux liukaitaii]|uniref:hypothetical protein n=1 Tax=Herbiconiux liukaitaii TaxID=3342799 RepID=UPI0035BB5985
MTVMRSPEFRRASRRVLRWARWYTRGLDTDIAGERLEQLASDLHDHAIWAEDAGLSAAEATRAMTRRGLRGAVDDVSWRRDQLRRRTGALSAANSKRRGTAMLLAVGSMGLVLISSGSAALIKATRFYVIQDDEAIAAPLVFLAISLAVAAGGMLLLVPSRTRFLGAGALGASAAFIVQNSFDTLLYSSALVNQVMYLDPVWPLPKYVLIGALMMYFAAAALWWSPTRVSSNLTEEAR